MDDFDLARDFDRAAALDDDSAWREMLLSGMPIHIARDDTQEGHVIRVQSCTPDASVSIDSRRVV